MKKAIVSTVDQFEDKEVVVDGNLVTLRYPMNLPFFMSEVIKLVRK